MSAVTKALGLAPKAPKIEMAATPAAPTTDDARLAAESRDEQLRRRGRRSTVLTGPEGVASTPQTGRTTLLGN